MHDRLLYKKCVLFFQNPHEKYVPKRMLLLISLLFFLFLSEFHTFLFGDDELKEFAAGF